MKKTRIIILIIIFFTGLWFFGNKFLLKLKNQKQFLELDNHFFIFKDKLNNIKQIGYLTNKDMSVEENKTNLQKAKYALSPTIIEFNDPQAEFNLLDYTSPVYTILSLKNIHAVPIIKTETGLVLAQTQK